MGFSADGKRIRKKVSGKNRTEVRDKPGRAAKTVEANRDALRPLLTVIGTIAVKDLTVSDVRTALSKMAATQAVRTLQKAPRGQEERSSLTLNQASALLEAAEKSRLHAFIVLCLLTGVRSEKARALRWDHVDLDAGTIMVRRLSALMAILRPCVRAGR